MSFGRKFRHVILDLTETLMICSLVFAVVYVFIGQLLEVEGNSMFPTYHDGERMIAEKISMRYKEIKRGEVVIFQHPGYSEKHLLIKRVIGLPGETFEMKDGFVYINDEKPDEPYIQNNILTQEIKGGILKENVKYTLEPDSYILLGDNREQSTDSRYFGPIGKDKIVGRAMLVYQPLSRFRFVEQY
jgi:signal peptidase I